MLRSRVVALLLLALAVFVPKFVVAQSEPQAPVYSRKNSFGVFGEYSNDSSHILLGEVRQRKLLNFGLTYSRSLVRSHVVDFQYLVEVRPVILESDPVIHYVETDTDPSGTTQYSGSFVPYLACHSGTFTGTFNGVSGTGGLYTVKYTEVNTCGRQWTFGEGLSPVGIKLNFLTRHRLQPIFTGLGGYMFTTQPIPVPQAGSFNFTFEFGAGFEFYRSREKSKSLFGNRSIRAEYRYHHISNHDTASENPGIDSGLFQVTYAFGR